MAATIFEPAFSVYVEKQLTHGVGTEGFAQLCLEQWRSVTVMLCDAPVIAQVESVRSSV